MYSQMYIVFIHYYYDYNYKYYYDYDFFLLERNIKWKRNDNNEILLKQIKQSYKIITID